MLGFCSISLPYSFETQSDAEPGGDRRPACPSDPVVSALPQDWGYRFLHRVLYVDAGDSNSSSYAYKAGILTH